MSQQIYIEKMQSHCERKLARQRQLEMMEAAASGTAPSMELDTSSFSETVQGNPTHDEEEAEPSRRLGSVTSSTHSSRLGSRDQPLNTVNLMDHDTGNYSLQTSTFKQVMASVKTLQHSVLGPGSS
jgi:hypothetical protein